MKGDRPRYVNCDPHTRIFPKSWKNTYFRRNARKSTSGSKYKYYCPLCSKGFDHSQLNELHGDHIWPFSLFGETSWENYQLLCGSCNQKKSNAIDIRIRDFLTKNEFREKLYRTIKKALSENKLTLKETTLESILGTVKGPAERDKSSP